MTVMTEEKQKVVPFIQLKDPNVYVNTHIRINTKGYRANGGMPGWSEGDKRRESFHQECERILDELGFKYEVPKSSGYCYEGKRGQENLYCHPDDFSGYLKKSSIPIIEEIIKDSLIIEHRWTDRYEEAYHYTEEELKQELEMKKTYIQYELLKIFKTNRSNLYKSESAISNISANIPYFEKGYQKPLKRVENDFIFDEFKSLLNGGKIKSAKTKSGMGYQTVLEKNRVKKSPKYENAFVIKDMNGHYFLHESKPCEFDDFKISIEYVFYDGKWRQDTCYMDRDFYYELLLHI